MRAARAALLSLSLALLAGTAARAAGAPAAGRRLVSLSKQYTEMIFALGAQADLVAVDLSSTWPPEAKKLTNVGYHRALSAEGLISVKPTLVLHDDNVGPEQVLQQLAQLGIPVKVFAHKGDDLAGAEALLTEMGAFFDKAEQARALNAKLEADMAKALAAAKQYAKKPKVMVVHFGRAMNVYLTMTRSSTAGRMVEWAGGEMAVQGERGMVQLSPEVVAQADPDVLLLTDFGYDRVGGAAQVGSVLPGLAATRAVKSGRVYRVEEHDLVYLGPRTGENVLGLQKLIHGGE